MDDVFQRESRARNMRRLPWVGDPERWGGHASGTFNISAAGGPVLQFFTPEVFRAQTQDLIAVGWDLLASWSIQGFQQANDSVQCVIELSLGVGQVTSVIAWDLGSLSPAGNVPNPVAAALGIIPPISVRAGGVAVSGSPFIATALTGRALVSLSTTAAAHNVTVSINAQCAPRSWASPPFAQ